MFQVAREKSCRSELIIEIRFRCKPTEKIRPNRVKVISNRKTIEPHFIHCTVLFSMKFLEQTAHEVVLHNLHKFCANGIHSFSMDA